MVQDGNKRINLEHLCLDGDRGEAAFHVSMDLAED